MGYYGQGDYYAQGGLFDFVRNVGRSVVGAVAGGLTGGIGGAIRGAISPHIRQSVPSIGTQVPASFPQGGSGLPTIQTPGFVVRPGAILPGGVPFISPAQDAPPQGYHLNRTAYFLRDGTFVPARSRYVRNRTRNNANGRALRRAIGRVSGFAGDVKRSRKSLKSIASI